MQKFEDIIQEHASFKRDGVAMKIKGDYYPALCFSFIGGACGLCGIIFSPSPLGVLCFFVSFMCVTLGLIIRNATKEREKKIADLFDEVWSKNQWNEMMLYLGAQYSVENVGRFLISKEVIIGITGSLTIGQVIGWVGSYNSKLNTSITGWLLFISSLCAIASIGQKTFYSNRKDDLEITIRSAKKYAKYKNNVQV